VSSRPSWVALLGEIMVLSGPLTVLGQEFQCQHLKWSPLSRADLALII
jgi:hypothetical protein